MSVFHKDKATQGEVVELRNKVIALLTENDIDVSLLDIRALKSYGGDVRVYLTNVERQNKKVSFRATGEKEKQADGSYRQKGTKGRHFVTERECAIFNAEDFKNNDKEIIDYSIYQIKRYLNKL
jgi:hypothetical protein